MAELIVNISGDKFDAATMKIECAKSIVTAFGIFMADVDDGEIQVAGHVMNEAMMGVSYLLQYALGDLTGHS